MLVDKYLKSIKDQRTDLIEYVDLEDVGSEPSEEEKSIAKRYGVTATPVLRVIKGDDEDCVLEEFIGGLSITQNIRRTFDKYCYD